MTNPNDAIAPYERQSGFNFGGLTKREYFALKILQGFSSRDNYKIDVNQSEWYAKMAVKTADELIYHLNKGKE